MKTEVEVKLQIPDTATFDRLLTRVELAGYTLDPIQKAEIVDRYYDTVDAALLRGGYACRLRYEGTRVLATVKGLGGAKDGVHQRQEWEVSIQDQVEPRSWPNSSARALVLSLIEDRPLELLFELRQTRHQRRVTEGGRTVGLLSLDHIVTVARGRTLSWHELEIELEADGRLSDLERLKKALEASFGLHPEPESKFARVLRWRQATAEGDNGPT